MHRRRLIATLFLGSIAAGCGGRAVDSIDLLPLARHGLWRFERSRIPVEREEVAELGDGWTRSRNTAGGQHFYWASDSVSTLNLLCVEPRDLELQATVRPFTWPGSPQQGVSVELNGRSLGSWKTIEATELRIPLPAKLLRPGDNMVRFVWAYAPRVSDVRARKGRQRRAAAITDLIVAGLPERAAADHPIPSEDGLFLPPRSELRIAVWAANGAQLEIETGAGSEAGLQVWTRREGEDLTLRWASNRPGDERRLRLGEHDGPVEIALRSLGSTEDAPRVVTRAQVVWPSAETPKPPPVERTVVKPDILLYVVDTLRADRLSCYGGPSGISPALDRLASDGVVFERAVAQSSWTKPSMVSVLSGLLTTEHGVRHREPRIPSEVTLVAELLRAAGYRTGAFTANAYLVKAAGFDRGFETFEYARKTSDVITHKALGWLDEVGDQRPTFLWIHTIDPHAPYEPLPPFKERWAPGIPEGVGSIDHIRSLVKKPAKTRHEFKDDFLALYDGEVAQNDASLGLVLDWLQARGRYRDSLIVFLSDHGEEFWEHGVNGHGWDLFEEVLHVPMVIKPIGWKSAGLRRRDVVEHIDLAPTLLAAAGLKAPEKLRGRNLLATEGRSEYDHRVAFSEMTYEGREGLSVRWRQLKLIVPRSRSFLPSTKLFDLDRDPDERQPISNLPVTTAWLALEGRRYSACLDSAPNAEVLVAMDEKTRKGLEALGYVDPAEDDED